MRDDILGHRLREQLIRARARGVEVRLLYDPLGSRTTARAFFASLEDDGVAVRAYRPWSLPLRGSARWPRDHARNMCIDDVSFLGGVAFGDEWLPKEDGGRGWHDVCCEVKGPAAQTLREAFELRWEDAVSRARPENRWVCDWRDLAVMVDAPADKQGIYAKYRESVQTARSRIWIENGYFFPPRRLWQDLRAAAQRGVDVRVIVPAGSDVPLLASAARGEYGRWLKSGIQLFEYTAAMCHSKFAIVDSDWCTIGSFNLNPTSLISTNECNLFVFDRRFQDQLAILFVADLTRSVRMTEERMSQRGLRERLIGTALSTSLRLVEASAWLGVGAYRRLSSK